MASLNQVSEVMLMFIYGIGCGFSVTLGYVQHQKPYLIGGILAFVFLILAIVYFRGTVTWLEI